MLERVQFATKASNYKTHLTIANLSSVPNKTEIVIKATSRGFHSELRLDQNYKGLQIKNRLP